MSCSVGMRLACREDDFDLMTFIWYAVMFCTLFYSALVLPSARTRFTRVFWVWWGKEYQYLHLFPFSLARTFSYGRCIYFTLIDLPFSFLL